jgi:hypothetical protein
MSTWSERGGGAPGPTQVTLVSDTMCALFRPSQLEQPLYCSQVEYVTGASLMVIWEGCLILCRFADCCN